MIDRVDISPNGAGSATFTHTTDEQPYGYVTYIHIVATANPGYKLSHFIERVHQREYRTVPPVDRIFDRHLSQYPTGQLSIYEFHSDDPLGLSEEIVLSVTAVFIADEQDSAVNLTLVSNPVGIGNLTGGGLKSGEVGSSANFSVTAEVSDAQKTQYIFSHWIDDAGVRRYTKSFSKAFTLKSGYTVSSPEQKTFTAYFRRFTGLILRSASSGAILRGRANRILRDE